MRDVLCSVIDELRFTYNDADDGGDGEGRWNGLRRDGFLVCEYVRTADWNIVNVRYFFYCFRLLKCRLFDPILLSFCMSMLTRIHAKILDIYL